jgi:hypothetical protein
MNNGAGVRNTDGDDTSNAWSRMRSLDVQLASLLDQMRADDRGQDSLLRHYHNEFTSIRNEGVTTFNQLHADTAQLIGNNAVECGHQSDVLDLAEQRAVVARAEAGMLI